MVVPAPEPRLRAVVQRAQFRVARRAGYDAAAVDAFVAELQTWVRRRDEIAARVGAGTAPTDGELSELSRSAAAVRELRLPMARRGGYEVVDVDDFLDLVETHFAAHDAWVTAVGGRPVPPEVKPRRRWWQR